MRSSRLWNPSLGKPPYHLHARPNPAHRLNHRLLAWWMYDTGAGLPWAGAASFPETAFYDLVAWPRVVHTWSEISWATTPEGPACYGSGQGASMPRPEVRTINDQVIQNTDDFTVVVRLIDDENNIAVSRKFFTRGQDGAGSGWSIGIAGGAGSGSSRAYRGSIVCTTPGTSGINSPWSSSSLINKIRTLALSFTQGSSLEFYFDGLSCGATATGYSNLRSSTYGIGAPGRNGGSDYTGRGYYIMLCMYDRVLTADEHLEIHQEPYGGFDNQRLIIPSHRIYVMGEAGPEAGTEDTLEVVVDEITAELGPHLTASVSDTLEIVEDEFDPPPIEAGHYTGEPEDTTEIITEAIAAILHGALAGALADSAKIITDEITASLIAMDWQTVRWVAPLKITPLTDDVDPLYLAAHAVRHPTMYFQPRIKTYGQFARSIGCPAGFIRTGDVQVQVLDPDNAIRQAIADKTIRKALAQLRLGPEGGSYAGFLKPYTREVGTVTQPGDGVLNIPLRDFTYDWMAWQVPTLINETLFPNLPDTAPSFANIVIGTVEADTGAIPCPLVDTTQYQYLVARHPCLSVDAVYRKRGDEDEFTLVDPGEYTVTDTDNLMNDRYGCVIQFSSDQEGAEIRANVQGIYDEDTSTLTLTNFADCIKEIFLYLVGVTEDLDRMNFNSFTNVATKVDHLECAGAWTKPLTFGEAFTQLQRSSNIDIFNDKDDRITVAYTDDDDEPEVNLDDLLRLYKGTVKQALADPTYNRIPYRYNYNFAAGTWTEDAYDNDEDQAALGVVVEEEPLQMYFVRDEATALEVAAQRSSWLDLNAFRFEGEIPLIPTVEVLELAQLVAIEHFGGIKSGGYTEEQFKILELTMDVDHLKYRFKGIRRRTPPPVRIESSVSGYSGDTPTPTLVVTPIDGTVAENARFGPFNNGVEGELFGIFRDEGATNKLVAWYTTDYGVNWYKADDSNAPTLSNVIGSYDCWVDSGLIHIATQENGGGRVAYHTFNMASNIWGTVDEQVVASVTNGDSNCVSIETRGAGGNPLIYFQGDKELVSGQYFHRGYYSELILGAWSAPGGITPDPGVREYATGPSSDCIIQRVISGQMDRMHFFWTVSPATTWVQWSPDEWGRSMDSAGVLEGAICHAITGTYYPAGRNVGDPVLYGDKIAFCRKVGWGIPAVEVYSEGPSLTRVSQVATDATTVYNSFGATDNPATFVRYVGGLLYIVQATWRRYVTINSSDDDGASWGGVSQAGEAYSYPVDIQTLGGDIVTVRGVPYVTYFSSPWNIYSQPVFRWMRLDRLPFA